jgi:hypothetical protein
MNIRRSLIEAIQDDARRAGERDRLLLEARRARKARRPLRDPAAPARHLARLLSRWTTAQGTSPRSPESYGAPQVGHGRRVLLRVV